jgi:Transposase DDE domain
VTTEDFIIQLFCLVDDQMHLHQKHRQARLWPSELVTIGLLFALKGGYFRAFYRWLKRDYEGLFVELPHRTRLQRLLATHQDWCDLFLADPTFFTVIDSYGIELIHPIREGRSPRQLGKKGKSNWRWIVGMKLCWLVNDRGEVVRWSWDTANVHDQVFLPLVAALENETIVLADSGFNCLAGIPANLKLCSRGKWNERMLVETTLSLVTMVCGLKKVFHRSRRYFQARLAYVAAMYNALLKLNRVRQPGADPQDRLLHLAEYAL